MSTFASDLIASRELKNAAIDPVFSTGSFRALSVELTYCQPTVNPAARVDVDGPLAIGRLTLWSDGSYHSEVLRVRDECQLHSEHGHVLSSAELVAALSVLCQRVASG